jgi:hypothetical protein
MRFSNPINGVQDMFVGLPVGRCDREAGGQRLAICHATDGAIWRRGTARGQCKRPVGGAGGENQVRNVAGSAHNREC